MARRLLYSHLLGFGELNFKIIIDESFAFVACSTYEAACFLYD